MDLEGLVSGLVAAQQPVLDVGLAGRRHQGRHNVLKREDAVEHLAPRECFPASGSGRARGSRPPSPAPSRPRNGEVPPSGQLNFSAPLSLAKTTMVSSAVPTVVELFQQFAHHPVQLHQAVGIHAQAGLAPPTARTGAGSIRASAWCCARGRTACRPPPRDRGSPESGPEDRPRRSPCACGSADRCP